MSYTVQQSADPPPPARALHGFVADAQNVGRCLTCGCWKESYRHGPAPPSRSELIARLAECYRITGADPDGNEDWRLAGQAVAEVRSLREEFDKLEAAMELRVNAAASGGKVVIQKTRTTRPAVRTIHVYDIGPQSISEWLAEMAAAGERLTPPDPLQWVRSSGLTA